MRYFIQNYKTSILGVAMVAFAGFLQWYLFVDAKNFEVNYTVLSIGVVGLALVLAPDTLIDTLKKFLSKKGE